MESSWQRLVGAWTTAGSHPYLPGVEIHGRATFEWLAGEQFLIWRSEYEHPDIPDAIAIIGLDGSMHYFDSRGVSRTYAASLVDGVWRFGRDDPGFLQRFTGTFSADGDAIAGRGEMARDGGDWEDDLTLNYRRAT
jgi:hypothetical protein